ncbi:alpha/beta fold hydrolase [Brevibacillus choshinensis]|uniref:alpha/beta fold hydrolase n=1 Tax=Brevibacillus choshinensis TaxID=54911 RepID=UPI002E231E11|nr:alpha/beta fold hydrolase [Brevibacillus choshinensis]
MDIPLKNQKCAYEYFFQSDSVQAKETLVLVHGLGLDKSVWKELVPLLVDSYHILLYDVRGHGNSTLDVNDLTWELLCDDLIQIASELKIDDFHFVGYGLGGNLGIQFAINYPERLKTLSLLSTISFYPTSLTSKLHRHRNMMANEQSIVFMAKAMVPNIIYPHTTEKEQLLVEAYAKVTKEDYFSFGELIMQSLNVTPVEKIKCPTLVLCGELDPIYPPNAIGVIGSYIPNVRFLVVPRASNAVQLDQPQVVSNWLREFFQDSRDNNDIFNKTKDSITLELNSEFRALIDSQTEKAAVHRLGAELIHTFRVKMNGHEILHGWNRRNAKELLVYLLIHGRVNRETLYDVFWPGVHIDKARNHLRVSLNHLKSLFKDVCAEYGGSVVAVDREYIYLKVDYTCDLLEYIQEVEAAYKEPDLGRRYSLFQAILSMSPSTFLSGFYQDWVLELRGRMEDMVVDMAMSLAMNYKNNNQYEEAIKYLNIALKLHPEDEKIVEEILSLYEKTKRPLRKS